MQVGERFGKVVVKAVNADSICVQCDCGSDAYEVSKQYLARRQETQCRSCGWAMRRKMREGDRYDKLIVTKLQSHKGRLLATCRCDCGNVVRTRAELLLRNKGNSCGCQPSPLWKGHGQISLTFFNRIRQNAAIRGISFDLTIEYLWALLQQQEHRCALSGLPIYLNQQTAGKSTASVDRICNDQGYTVGNVQWLHKDVNMMKRDHNQPYFLDLCLAIISFRAAPSLPEVPDGKP